MGKKQPIHYVDNKEFTKEVIKYADSVREAQLKGEEEPQINNYIGECVLKIARGLASRPNFSGYSYKDEMISDGLENVFMYLYNFDPVKQDLTKIFCNYLVRFEEKISSKSKKITKEIIIPKNKKEAIEIIKNNLPIKEFPCDLLSSPEKVWDRIELLSDEELEDFMKDAYKATQRPKFSMKRMNSVKTANAFAYVSQMIYFAFLRRIDKESKQQHIREKSIEQAGIHTMYCTVQEHDDTIYNNQYLEMMQNNVDSDYQEKRDKKIKDRKNKK